MSDLSQLREFANLNELPRVLGHPDVRGVIRSKPEDFIVTETLPFAPSGEGEHLFLRVRKREQNTRWVAARLAQALQIRACDVGYAGLKDRYAVAEQWFSAWVPGRSTPTRDEFDIAGVELVQIERHTSKLRRGMLSGNRFDIRIRHLQGDREQLRTRLERLEQTPVPNYFGAQRFGRDRRNLELLGDPAPDRRVSSRDARSFGLSALRSALFNGYLKQRIDARTWRTPLSGEILFYPSLGRYSRGDNAGNPASGPGQPTGLLWGVGRNQSAAVALRTETEFFAQFPQTLESLARYEPRMCRRALEVQPRSLLWSLGEDQLHLRFELGRGQFATSVLRELVDITDVAAA